MGGRPAALAGAGARGAGIGHVVLRVERVPGPGQAHLLGEGAPLAVHLDNGTARRGPGRPLVLPAHATDPELGSLREVGFYCVAQDHAPLVTVEQSPVFAPGLLQEAEALVKRPHRPPPG